MTRLLFIALATVVTVAVAPRTPAGYPPVDPEAGLERATFQSSPHPGLAAARLAPDGDDEAWSAPSRVAKPATSDAGSGRPGEGGSASGRDVQMSAPQCLTYETE